MFRTLVIDAALVVSLVGARALPAGEPRSPEEKPGRPDQPINIMPSGNRLLVISDDPEALRLVQELVRLMRQPAGSDGNFEVIRLKHANAVETAKLLDELYNGPTSQNLRAPRGGFNPSTGSAGGPAGIAPTSPRENRIRVVADPATNSLLVQAGLLDQQSIRRLLERAIDVGNTDSSALRRSWLLPPLQYANASEVGQVLREVYGTPARSTPGPAMTGGLAGLGIPAFGDGQDLSRETNDNSRVPGLSLGVDDRSNSLVLVCSEKLKDEVKRVVDQLDQAAKTSTRTVRVIPVRGIDPLLVQQAIEAIQGRSRSVSRSDSGGLSEFGTTRFGPSGWNGFQPNGLGPANMNPAGLAPFPGGVVIPGGRQPDPGNQPGNARER